MRVSRRLLAWGGDGRVDGVAHTLEHAAFYERTLLNAVMGTQRGTHPGSMLYMYPMGSGVSKASYTSGSDLHHWGDPSTHWCCQGTGIEGFARLADSVFWQPTEHGSEGDAGGVQLFVLQSISSRLVWDERGCAVEVEADAAGSRAATEPLRTELRVLGHGSSTRPRAFILWIRIPGWAKAMSVGTVAGGLSLSDGEQLVNDPSDPAAGQLLAVTFAPPDDAPTGRFLGSISLQWSMALRWERIKDT
eukprot:5062275-Prymnesium_polylepis.1